MDEPEASLPPAAPEPFELTLEDTSALRQRGLKVPPTSVHGYNPYDAGNGAVPKHTAEPADKGPRKRTDLRKLSEWIQLQRRVQTLKQQDQTEEPEADEGPPKK